MDGITFSQARDGKRLTRQLEAVWEVVKDGRWYSPFELEVAVGVSWASVSARLRDLRKKRYGGHEVQRRRVAGGLFQYRVVR